jgi:hypothetical protein
MHPETAETMMSVPKRRMRSASWRSVTYSSHTSDAEQDFGPDYVYEVVIFRRVSDPSLVVIALMALAPFGRGVMEG